MFIYTLHDLIGIFLFVMFGLLLIAICVDNWWQDRKRAKRERRKS